MIEHVKVIEDLAKVKSIVLTCKDQLDKIGKFIRNMVRPWLKVIGTSPSWLRHQSSAGNRARGMDAVLRS